MTSSHSVRRRLRRIDPRLIIGLALVAASVVGIVVLLANADRTVAVVAAREPLLPGDRVGLDDLDIVRVRLEDALEHYLSPLRLPEDGLVVNRPVAAGELVPESAVGDAGEVTLAPVVIAVDGVLPGSVEPTAVVDVWAAVPAVDGTPGVPAVIVTGAVVVRLVETDTLVAGGEVVGVEVLVPRAELAPVLSAVAGEADLAIVPTTVPVP